jgi:ATP-dependent RNA helicase SUPV3L1/SUV3
MRASITAVLGPTNTGKTHLAVERLCAHSSGMMGFPLRLLAREVYDRVVAIKGPKEVALITGEEKILPEGARWLLCTVESMPVGRDLAFVALDEAQLGADPERGHVFTDRLLNARGREETLILGSESLRPLIRRLIPEAEITSRPRFSKLSYGGIKKLSRLPPRSAIVAFSAEEVYTIAEMIRRTRGGAAVVMGALSPRTRNAQVAMFQAGEVDYLVATDAIGMGLNMDVSHIAFASLSKFDGHRQRRLTVSEMAQIAGRAGRHQRDGSFGTLAGAAFSDVEIDRIEEHRFAALDHLYWRNAEPDYHSLEALADSLEKPPINVGLRAAPEADDLAVLKYMLADSAVRRVAQHPSNVARLWDVCGLPDFRKVGPEFHARLVARIFTWLAPDGGRIPSDHFARELARLDTIQGDIATLAARIAAVRTWAYVAQRLDWIDDPLHWTARTSALESKLSDALHAALQQRFVDRRTTILMKAIGSDPALLDVQIEPSGDVAVEGEVIGRLDGFRFSPDPLARLGDRKRLLAAAELRLPKELARRAENLAQAPDHELLLETAVERPVAVIWRGLIVATLTRGSALLLPKLALDATVAQLPIVQRQKVEARLALWLASLIAKRLSPLQKMATFTSNPEIFPEIRAFFAQLVERGGVIARDDLSDVIAALSPDQRRRIRQMGVVIGAMDVFQAQLLKPEATRLRLALLAVRNGQMMPPLPMPGLGLLDQPSPDLAQAASRAGYRRFGDQMLRVDLTERIARAVHDQRSGKEAFAPDRKIASALGIGDQTLTRILRALGFVALAPAEPTLWRWRGRRKVDRTEITEPRGAFAALGALRQGRRA